MNGAEAKPGKRDAGALGDIGSLIVTAIVVLILHTLTNGRYGFHRDELAVIDDARQLSWGYVAYPPLVPFIARVASDLSGPSLVTLRFFGALAQSIALVLTGLMARELGATRRGQLLAALASTVAPFALFLGAVFQYTAFDYLWWTLTAYLAIRLLKSGEPRWWLAIGATLGVGLLTRYSIAFCVAGLGVGVVASKTRRQLASPWPWLGAIITVLIALPNFIWQAQHGFIALEFLSHIHLRDVSIGRTDSFFIDQFIVSTNPLTVPLWATGIYFYFVMPSGESYRPLGWMYVVPLAALPLLQGRGYYLAPAYPMLFAAGALIWDGWLASLTSTSARRAWVTIWGALAVGGAIAVGFVLPLAPVGSPWWDVASELNGDLKEEIGWPELVDAVAAVYAGLPAADRSRTGILAGNYGEAGAIDLYGPSRGLPPAISGINSYWYRGYGDPPPLSLIVIGLSRRQAESIFLTCELAGQVTNRYGVRNEETIEHPDIFLCRGLRRPWPLWWKDFQSFG